ncbi:glycosyltransferase family 2 protein [Larkinella soli]|uniref:glycosyltransferase family 2 protein n=1 Tax=Larkinella soli TaxID=1770527 RepID=UPI0013E2D168|nr:glycosyltransferase family 2 protein [Larkinella soli]
MNPYFPIAVVIPTFNRKECLADLLHQLFGQQPGDFTLEIVVVVDGSSDGTREMLETDFPGVQVVQGPGNWWFTRSVNEGIRSIRSRRTSTYVLILNDDSVVEPDYLRQLTRAQAEAGPEAIVGSLSVTEESPRRITFGGTKRTLRWLMKTIDYVTPFEPYVPGRLTGLHPTQSLNGRGTLVPVAVFDRIGLLDERRFPQYGSDDDLALTALRAGIPVYISWDAVVFDRVRLTAAGTPYLHPSLSVFLNSFFNRYSVNSIRKTVFFYRKHGLPLVWPLGVALSVAATWRAWFWKYRHIRIE